MPLFGSKKTSAATATATGMATPAAAATPAATIGPSPVTAYRVTDFYQSSDGQDYAPAFRRVFAAGSAGSPTGFAVEVPPGVYPILTVIGNSQDSSMAGAYIPSHCTLFGHGPDASIIQFGPNMPNQAMMFENANPTTGDVTICLRNLMLDGNAAKQSTSVADRHLGVYLSRVRGVWMENVVAKNVFGTTGGANGPNGTYGEGQHLFCHICTDVFLTSCVCLTDDGGQTSGGIGVNDSVNVTLVGCVGHDMLHAHGIADFDVFNIKYIGCSAYRNSAGFLSELSGDVVYQGCVAGGITNVYASYPYASNTPIGNTDYGFALIGCVRSRLDGCVSAHNGGAGIQIVPEGRPPNTVGNDIVLTGCKFGNNGSVGVWCDGSYDITCIGCDSSNNAKSGFYVDPSTTQGTIRFDACRAEANTSFGYECHGTNTAALTQLGGCKASGNTVNDLGIAGVGYSLAGALPAPAIPATSGTAVANPYPLAVVVYVAAHSNTSGILVNGASTGITSGAVRLQPGQSITLAWQGSAPTWTWFADQL